MFLCAYVDLVTIRVKTPRSACLLARVTVSICHASKSGPSGTSESRSHITARSLEIGQCRLQLCVSNKYMYLALVQSVNAWKMERLVIETSYNVDATLG